MITLYTGVPGSGKTYKMVYDLSKFLEKNPDIMLISNIRNLKFAHTSFDDYLEELYPKARLTDKIEKFFDFEHQQSLNTLFGGPVMYVLDECQLYFPRRNSLPNTEAYLQRHRHLGHYLFLATQSVRLINSNFVPLIESEFHAGRRTISLFGEIHYKEKSPQSPQTIKTVTLRPNKKIFSLYQSFEAKEINKPKPALWKIMILPLLLSPFFYLFHQKYMKVPVKEVKKIESPTGSTNIRNNNQTSLPPRPVQNNQVSQAELEATKMAMRLTTDKNKELLQLLEKKERVFLPVLQIGDVRMTVCPDTQAVIPIEKVKHKVVCVSEGLSCYYDRFPNEAISLANVDYTFPGNGFVIPTPVKPAREKDPGPASFVDEELVKELANK